MQQAYDALEKKDRMNYRIAVIHITEDVKYLIKNEELDPEEGERIREYFWGQVE